MTIGSVALTQQIPTQVTKPKSSKSRSKKPTSIVSQKTTVVTTTITHVVSDQDGELGEGQGENQRNPQDKVGELSESHQATP